MDEIIQPVPQAYKVGCRNRLWRNHSGTDRVTRVGPSSASSVLARPLSVAFASPSAASRVLAGFRVRWGMGCGCQVRSSADGGRAARRTCGLAKDTSRRTDEIAEVVQGTGPGVRRQILPVRVVLRIPTIRATAGPSAPAPSPAGASGDPCGDSFSHEGRSGYAYEVQQRGRNLAHGLVLRLVGRAARLAAPGRQQDQGMRQVVAREVSGFTAFPRPEFRATTRFMRRCCALNTRPMPPVPIRSSRRHSYCQ